MAGSRAGGGTSSGAAVQAKMMPIQCAIGLASPKRIDEIATIINVRVNGIKRTQTHRLDPSRTREVVDQEPGAEFLEAVMDRVNNYLAISGVPRVDIKVEDQGASGWGTFSSQEWTMKINLNRLSKKVWSVNDAKELAVTIYHELRHAEQWFLMARYAATQFKKLDANGLSAMLQGSTLVPDSGMNLNAVQAAMKLKTKKGSKAYKLGKELYTKEFTTGEGDGGVFGELSMEHLETIMANDRASVRFRQVRDEIRAYNSAKPVEPSLEVVGDMDVDPKAARVIALHKSHPDSQPYYDAYQEYLLFKSFACIEATIEAHEHYVMLPMESDAHSVETRLRDQLGVERGSAAAKMPKPKKWSPGD